MQKYDLSHQKLLETVASMQNQEEFIFRQAIEKWFGICNEENISECSIDRIEGIKYLKHGDKTLCVIYPPERETYPGEAAETRITYTQKYRIF
ncbi:TPA: hypothetical protein N2G45_002881 [Salmonella enterica]|nr:hypothetical protein [Salmonella enterica]